MKKIHSKFVSKKLMSYAIKEKTNLFIGFLISFLNTFLLVVGPLIIGYILNNHIRPNMSSYDLLKIAGLLVIYFLIYLLSGICVNFSKVYFEITASNVAYAIRKDVYKHVNNLPISYFDSLPAGSIVARVVSDTNRLKSMFGIFLSEIISNTIIFVAMFVMIFKTNIFAGSLVIFLLPILLLIFFSTRYLVSKFTIIARSKNSDLTSKINENIQNIEIINAFNQEENIFNEYNAVNKELFNANLKLTWVYSFDGFVAVENLSFIGIAMILIYFGYGRLGGAYDVSIGSLYIAIEYVTKIFNSFQSITGRFSEFERSYASAKHVFELLEMEPLKELNENLLNSNGDIEFKDIHFAYDRDDVLRGVNFKVKNGESIAFVGSTGSGKSTIINLLLNFYSPRSGSITIGNQDIKNINRNKLREDMAVVLQDPFIFEASIRDNITLNDDFNDEQIIKSLKDLGATNIINKGLDTKLIEKGLNLSSGERQLISFARAYIRNPKILILDEATSNIDTDSELIIQKAIDTLKENRTTLIVAHRLSTIKNVNQIVVLKNGVILEKGTHQELLNLGGFYKEMYEEQIKKD